MGDRGGSTNSSTGWGVLGRNSSRWAIRVQVRGNFHILTSKKKLGGGGVNPLPPLGSAIGGILFSASALCTHSRLRSNILQ